MGFRCGIVGLPNVGKSTLFNALLETASAQVANFPFTTIEPNVGRVAVPDARLETIAALAKPAKITPTQLEFVDIAGLVRGASRGEGLGNRFLAHVREVDAILHVLRCFEDANVVHVAGAVDPVRGAEIVATELLLADLDGLERRLVPLTKRARGGDKEAKVDLGLVERALASVREGRPARLVTLAEEERKPFDALHLLTAKPVLHVCNVDEAAAATGNAHSARAGEMALAAGAACVVISAKIEDEVARLADAALRREFLASLGLREPGLARVVEAGYRLLGLVTFFTANAREARAWTIRQGTTARDAAGVVHTDFEQGFIAAETVAYDDYVAAGGDKGARDAGRSRIEGRDYVVEDGDVLLFRFNV